MAKRFDLVVIGTGAGGSVVATKCRQAGWSVALVDSRPYGGTCALRGCDPKKVLVGAAETIDAARRLRGKGVEGELRIAWPELMQFKRTFTEPVPANAEKRFAEAGITMFHGTARFVGPTSLQATHAIGRPRWGNISAGFRYHGSHDASLPSGQLRAQRVLPRGHVDGVSAVGVRGGGTARVGRLDRDRHPRVRGGAARGPARHPAGAGALAGVQRIHQRKGQHQSRPETRGSPREIYGGHPVSVNTPAGAHRFSACPPKPPAKAGLPRRPQAEGGL